MNATTLMECRKMISDWHRWGKIRTVKIDGKDVDRASEADIVSAVDLKISKKYLDLFVASGLVDVVHKEFTESPRDVLVMTHKGKIKDYNISNHALRQFLRRYFICNLDEKMKVHLSSPIKTSFEMIRKEIADILFKQDYNDALVMDLFLTFLRTATTQQTISSARDQRELARRAKRYENSVYLFSHPFMFVAVDGTITTVELSSQSFDCRNSNKIASSEERWRKFFEDAI